MLLRKNRSFERTEPSKDAKKIYIFCEGTKREFHYFNYFKEIDSRINIVVHELDDQEDNSPLGLYAKACASIIATEENPTPKYECIEGDEVWIVLDTDLDKVDSRAAKIEEVKKKCNEQNWDVVESNPCFEVWLYYHFASERPQNIGDDHLACITWKGIVNREIPGGFNSRKHPLNIETAVENSSKNYEDSNGRPSVGTTQVFRLSQSFLPLLKEKLDKAKAE
ncbi:RloB family protein [Taibaiella soli]|uniref:RloB domain-containing protein n=1 Tax=Taibaiella soli TaxID=1649169 RepID=A0A2W2AH08_9BACT|nr:RloB family protein [Taibaiella soli]PZF71500.1 RloB domain-containing protein [Taibaiella soli]